MFALHLQKKNLPAKIEMCKKVLRNWVVFPSTEILSRRNWETSIVIGRSLDFAISFEESGPATPMFFILSPGVDPLKDVEKHGNTLTCFIFNKL